MSYNIMTKFMTKACVLTTVSTRVTADSDVLPHSSLVLRMVHIRLGNPGGAARMK